MKKKYLRSTYEFMKCQTIDLVSFYFKSIKQYGKNIGLIHKKYFDFLFLNPFLR